MFQTTNQINLSHPVMIAQSHPHATVKRANHQDSLPYIAWITSWNISKTTINQEMSTHPVSVEYPKPSTDERMGETMLNSSAHIFIKQPRLKSPPPTEGPSGPSGAKRDAFRRSQEGFIAHRFHLTQQVIHMLFLQSELEHYTLNMTQRCKRQKSETRR